jgi:hypothetical protein
VGIQLNTYYFCKFVLYIYIYSVFYVYALKIKNNTNSTQTKTKAHLVGVLLPKLPSLSPTLAQQPLTEATGGRRGLKPPYRPRSSLKLEVRRKEEKKCESGKRSLKEEEEQ